LYNNIPIWHLFWQIKMIQPFCQGAKRKTREACETIAPKTKAKNNCKHGINSRQTFQTADGRV
jgi:hypothetical protein